MITLNESGIRPARRFHLFRTNQSVTADSPNSNHFAFGGAPIFRVLFGPGRFQEPGASFCQMRRVSRAESPGNCRTASDTKDSFLIGFPRETSSRRSSRQPSVSDG